MPQLVSTMSRPGPSFNLIACSSASADALEREGSVFKGYAP